MGKAFQPKGFSRFIKHAKEHYSSTGSDVAQRFYDNLLRVSSNEDDFNQSLTFYKNALADRVKHCTPDDGGILYDEYGEGPETTASADVIESWGVSLDDLYRYYNSSINKGAYMPTELVYSLFCEYAPPPNP